MKEGPFTANLAKSNFTWLSANAHNFAFANLDKNAMIETRPQAQGNGRTVKMGVVGLTIDSNNKDYQMYAHAYERQSYRRPLRTSVPPGQPSVRGLPTRFVTHSPTHLTPTRL